MLVKKINKTGFDTIIIHYAKMRRELSMDTAEGAHAQPMWWLPMLFWE